MLGRPNLLNYSPMFPTPGNNRLLQLLNESSRAGDIFVLQMAQLSSSIRMTPLIPQ